MEVLTMLAAVAMVIVGAMYPMVAIYILFQRLSAEEPAHVLEIAVRLFLIAAVPVAGIIGGLTILSADVGASSTLRAVASAAGLVTLVGFLILGTLRAARLARSRRIQS